MHVRNQNFSDVCVCLIVQIYNLCPALGPWLNTWKLLMKNMESNCTEIQELVNRLRETLNPPECRGLIDAFLIRKQTIEVDSFILAFETCFLSLINNTLLQQESGESDSQFNDENLLRTVTNLFAACTDTTGTTLRWGLLLMAKYPHIQGHIQIKPLASRFTFSIKCH